MSDNSKPTRNAALSFELTDLHQPRNTVTQSASGHLVDTPGPCTACDWDWPCPTITTIQDTLGDHQ